MKSSGAWSGRPPVRASKAVRGALSTVLLLACSADGREAPGRTPTERPTERPGPAAPARDGIWEELRVRVVGGRDAPSADPVVVLIHGYGATGEDLVPLAESIGAKDGTRFVLPEAPWPHPELPDGRAWWPLDLMALRERLARGEAAALRREVPVGLDAARGKVVELLGELQRRLGATGSRIVLGGYSQGAMLSCDVALESDRPLGGVVLLSGSIVAEEAWERGLARRRGVRFFVSHGRQDPLLPFSLADALRARLGAAGARVTWMPFDGGHEIPPEVVAGIGRFLRELP